MLYSSLFTVVVSFILILQGIDTATALPRHVPGHAALKGPPKLPQRGCGVFIDQDRVRSAEKQFHLSPTLAHEYGGNTNATLNIIFHIIYANKTTQGGYVSDPTIHDQVDVLNQDYINTGLSFSIANVTRVHNEEWFNNTAPDSPQERMFKKAHRQGGPADLNVYVVGSRQQEGKPILGYATFPMDYEQRPLNDGVVIVSSTLPGGSYAPFNKGRTLTHEVGHWMGLYHTFQGGCDGAGDEVDDTPAEAEPAYGCPAQRDTCPSSGADSITNYMNYVDDECMDTFTPGQIQRIKAQMRTYRKVGV